jgi:hypothetical protein
VPKRYKKSKDMKEIFIKICPRCGSTRISRTFGRRYVSPYFFCQDCNFEGPLFPETNSKELKKLPMMSPSPKYLMWRRHSTAETKPLERVEEMKTTNPVVKAVWIFLTLLLMLIFVLAIT